MRPDLLSNLVQQQVLTEDRDVDKTYLPQKQ